MRAAICEALRRGYEVPQDLPHEMLAALEVGDAGVMSKEREYRAYAGACVHLANKATNDEDKKHLLAIAEAWLGLADRVQRSVPEPDARSLHPALRAKFRCVT